MLQLREMHPRRKRRRVSERHHISCQHSFAIHCSIYTCMGDHISSPRLYIMQLQRKRKRRNRHLQPMASLKELPPTRPKVGCSARVASPTIMLHMVRRNHPPSLLLISFMVMKIMAILPTQPYRRSQKVKFKSIH